MGNNFNDDFKTIKRVFTADGKPVVTKLPDGQFDVLCYGNEDGKCRGCVYKRNGWRCGAMCRDKDHIHWIENRYLGEDETKGTRIKRARVWDTLVTEEGVKYQIVYNRHKVGGVEVVKVEW